MISYYLINKKSMEAVKSIENMTNSINSTVAADGLAPLGVRMYKGM